MKKNLLAILFLLCGVILQVAGAPFLNIMRVTPDIALVIALIYVVLLRFNKVWGIVVTAGVLVDIFSGLPFGLVSFSLVVVAYLIDWLNYSVIAAVRPWIRITLVWSGILLYHLTLLGLTRILQVDAVFSIKRLAVSGAYNLIVATICFYGLRKIFCAK